MKMAKKQSEIENAQTILNALTAKQADLAEARASDEATMASVSYDAHTGNQKSAPQLETLRDGAVRRDVEARNLDSAIEEAKRRLTAAQEAERQAEEARVASELQELASLMREVGAKCDRALKQFAEGSDELRKIIAATNQRGLGNPSAQQLQSLGERAIRGVLVNTPYAKAFEHLAPRERQDFALFTAAWASAIERFASQKLIKGGGKENAA